MVLNPGGLLHLLSSSAPTKVSDPSLLRHRRFVCAVRVAMGMGCISIFSLAAGCTPRYQSLYDSDVRFEHCYRVDEERQVAIIDKLQCWQDWNRHHSYGQSRDRISYAVARERTLGQALAAGEKAVPRGAAGESAGTLPQPMTAYAPPPPTMTPASAPGESAGDHGGRSGVREPAATEGATRVATSSLAMSSVDGATPMVDAPGASCSGGCGKTWANCKHQCPSGNCRTSCDEQYRGCMKGCF
jgi:hypothetical protein